MRNQQGQNERNQDNPRNQQDEKKFEQRGVQQQPTEKTAQPNKNINDESVKTDRPSEFETNSPLRGRPTPDTVNPEAR